MAVRKVRVNLRDVVVAAATLLTSSHPSLSEFLRILLSGMSQV